MTRELVLGAARLVGGRRVREVRFEARPPFSGAELRAATAGLAAACAALIDGPVEIALGAPALAAHARCAASIADAFCYQLAGTTLLILERSGATRLVDALLGTSHEPLTTLERRLVERFVAHALGARAAAARAGALAGAAWWVVDLRAEGALEAAFVLAAPACEPPRVGPAMAAATLGEVPLDLHVELAAGTLTARQLGALQVGDIVRMDTEVRDSATLKVAATTVACGEYGIVAGEGGGIDRPAFLVL